MKWEQGYSVGIAEIDEQHKILFECVTEIETAITREEKWSAVHFAISRLDDYVRVHFSTEQSLMRICGYPEIERHIEEHRQFEATLKRLHQASLALDASVEIVRYLRRWLVEHVAKSDREYALHFRTVRAPRRRWAGTAVGRWIWSRLRALTDA